MTTLITVSDDQINQLDLSPVEKVLATWLPTFQPAQLTDTCGPEASEDSVLPLRFQLDFPRDPADPRELSEIPEVRLWFVRLDTRYPWLPLLLDWEVGELGRYAAMLVPHQFSRTEGIQYNPEALEIFVMAKVFATLDWMQQQAAVSRTKIKFMTQILGYELDDAFFDCLGID